MALKADISGFDRVKVSGDKSKTVFKLYLNFKIRAKQVH